MGKEGTQKTLLVLGGSYGGISTAHYLLKHVLPNLPAPDSYQVVLASSSSQALCRQACPRALISDEMFNQEKLFVSIPKSFAQYPKDRFRFIQGTATNLDHSNRTVSVTLKHGEVEAIEFHALVIATGASTPSPLLGLNQDEDALRASWAEFRRGLASARSIVIAGGGPAGIETAGELGEYLNGRAGWFSSKMKDPKVPITVVTSGSNILPGLRPALASVAEGYLSKVGVTVIKNKRVQNVTPESGAPGNLTTKTTITLDNGGTLSTDLYIPATGTKPNTTFVHKSLLVADGRIDTNPSTLRVEGAGPRIYAVGDVASYSRPAVHILLEAIPILGTNMKRDLLQAAGRAPVPAEDKIFKEDVRETQLVPIGKSKGVGAMMGWKVPSFFVWLLKGRDYWLWTTGDVWSGKQWAKA
ncbi:hypothetical protein HYFRA_00014026 [Hymenoscyphus fraxineus]|uniref:FAD/NAD(P)-binding domain-containing protein n=1 Tax=Hymenoscyphus fraxineus TaxID=746836 RepID=A0A9N9LBH0_9HELO|nr:hypothetical protein HYFRA_00014026 [Hymenoscyphus fraxineus]